MERARPLCASLAITTRARPNPYWTSSSTEHQPSITASSSRPQTHTIIRRIRLGAARFAFLEVAVADHRAQRVDLLHRIGGTPRDQQGTGLDRVVNQAVDVDEQQLGCQHGGDSCSSGYVCDVGSLPVSLTGWVRQGF